MKVLRILFVPLLSLALLSNLSAQKHVEKTLVKSFNLQGNDVIDLDLQGDVVVKEWNSPSIRIEMLITLENGNETMLTSLSKAGRYSPTAEQSADALIVSMPDLEREILVRGEVLRDNVSYIISIPSNVVIKEALASTANVE